MQIPHAFFSRKAGELGFTLPAPGEYAIGALFMPRDTAWRNVIKSIIADQIKEEGLTLLGWRDVPTDNSSLGVTVKPTEPACMQVFIGRNGTPPRPRTISSAGCTSCASRSRRRSTSAATAASRAITPARCRAAP
ncbi:glutamate synthase domain-containing protein 1 [Bradyrhizobium sp. i1.3.1]